MILVWKHRAVGCGCLDAAWWPAEVPRAEGERRWTGGSTQAEPSCPSITAMSLALFRKWICQPYRFKDAFVVTTAMATLANHSMCTQGQWYLSVVLVSKWVQYKVKSLCMCFIGFDPNLPCVTFQNVRGLNVPSKNSRWVCWREGYLGLKTVKLPIDVAVCNTEAWCVPSKVVLVSLAR